MPPRLKEGLADHEGGGKERRSSAASRNKMEVDRGSVVSMSVGTVRRRRWGLSSSGERYSELQGK